MSLGIVATLGGVFCESGCPELAPFVFIPIAVATLVFIGVVGLVWAHMKHEELGWRILFYSFIIIPTLIILIYVRLRFF